MYIIQKPDEKLFIVEYQILTLPINVIYVKADDDVKETVSKVKKKKVKFNSWWFEMCYYDYYNKEFL